MTESKLRYVSTGKLSQKRLSALDALSVQQQKLLRDGLRAHYRIPLDLAGHVADPGCFGVKEGRKIDIETGCLLPILDQKAREVRRTSKARAVARLVTRGLVECCARGKWRLTARGVTVARDLYPLVKPMTKQQLRSDIAFREAIHSMLGPRRQRSRAKPPQAPKRVDDAQEAGTRSRWIIKRRGACARFVPICVVSSEYWRECAQTSLNLELLGTQLWEPFPREKQR